MAKRLYFAGCAVRTVRTVRCPGALAWARAATAAPGFISPHKTAELETLLIDLKSFSSGSSWPKPPCESRRSGGRARLPAPPRSGGLMQGFENPALFGAGEGPARLPLPPRGRRPSMRGSENPAMFWCTTGGTGRGLNALIAARLATLKNGVRSERQELPNGDCKTQQQAADLLNVSK